MPKWSRRWPAKPVLVSSSPAVTSIIFLSPRLFSPRKPAMQVTEWVGKARAFLPYTHSDRVKGCRTKGGIEIDNMSESRTEGRALNSKTVNVRKCQPEKPNGEPFGWIPK